VRKSTIFLLYTAVNFILFGFIFLHSGYHQDSDLPDLKEMAATVKRLELTDLSIFTEARYTRHPSQADLHSAFQDHPLSLEHFPSGSFVKPPEKLKNNYFHEKMGR